MTTENGNESAQGSVTISTNSKGEKQVTVKCYDIRNRPHSAARRQDRSRGPGAGIGP